MTSVPLKNLKLYADWKDAPLGSIVAYASPIFTSVPGQEPAIYEGPKLAIRAESSQGLQKFLVVAAPEAILATQANERAPSQIFGAVEAANGPAVDVTDQYELRVEPAPIQAHVHEDPAPLTVIQTIGDEPPRTLMFAGNISRGSRYLALDGDGRGKLFERPLNEVVVVGTLKLEPVKQT